MTSTYLPSRYGNTLAGGIKSDDLNWYDTAVVERIIDGQRPPRKPTPLERAAVVETLTEVGWSVRRIAEQTGWSVRTVDRYRARARDGWEPQRAGPRVRQQPQSACNRGVHDFSDPRNVYVRPNGKRECAKCRRQRDRQRLRAAEAGA